MDAEHCQRLEVRVSLAEQSVKALYLKLDETNRTIASYSEAHHKDMQLLQTEVNAIKVSLARWGGFCMALIAAGDALLFFFTGVKSGV